MTTNYLRLRRATAAALLIAVLLAMFASAAAVGSASDAAMIRLQPGYNAVTWNGAEPYPISDFADTPITQIHRWDAVGQEWLGRFVGRDGGRLPELHLLPRVQYLIVAEAKHELTIPDPITEIDPHAALRYPAAPDDPLRFEAYWPNEDSPLEDLVVLRGDDERLSVKAEIAGGVGEIEVYWVLDGRLNHQGLASDDVGLTPGAHDDAQLVAVDEMGQVAVVQLPRVVKLPPLDLPEMQFGVLAHIGSSSAWVGTQMPYQYPDQLRAALDLMVDAGLTTTMADWTWNPVTNWQYPLPHFDLAERELELRGMDVVAIAQTVPQWGSAMDVSSSRVKGPYDTPLWFNSPWSDPRAKAQEMAYMATRWSSIRYWMVAHESNLNAFYSTGDVVRLTDEIRAAALATYYANPQTVIIAPGLTGSYFTESNPGVWIGYPQFLQALYDLGFRRYVDVLAVHPFTGWWGSIDQTVAEMMRYIDSVRAIMQKNGDEDGILWATSHGWNTGDKNEGNYVREEIRAELQVAAFRALAEREDVSAAIIYNFMDTWLGAGEDDYGIVEYDHRSGSFIPKSSYWALREYLTGSRPRTTD